MWGHAGVEIELSQHQPPKWWSHCLQCCRQPSCEVSWSKQAVVGPVHCVHSQPLQPGQALACAVLAGWQVANKLMYSTPQIPE